MMNKKLLLICLLIWGLTYTPSIGAYSQETEGFIQAFEKVLITKSKAEQKSYLTSLSQLLSDPQLKKKAQVKQLIEELSSRVNFKLTGKKTTVATKISDGSNFFALPNLDNERLRTAWLERHNQARATQGIAPLHYHSELEKTATARSEYQVQNGYVGHKRNGNDGYYNYQGIKDWFTAMGVKFAELGGGRSAFSESMAYRTYTCQGSDCTDTALQATRKSFDAFMAEGAKGAHYKAIMMPHYSQMGVGFALDPATQRIYVTIHYAGDIIY